MSEEEEKQVISNTRNRLTTGGALHQRNSQRWESGAKLYYKQVTNSIDMSFYGYSGFFDVCIIYRIFGPSAQQSPIPSGRTPQRT